ncbi:DUF1007 family protein [Thiothrix subterranea]|uniref:DUF1007 family protein n=1 Tax=Thiothrix subterranea TaxID=2735563 RepID=UPI00192B4D73|nr:DUF1007 family protein [Thiothrix subterranea]QQZ27841.1 DUF1007 family protein [Thiothrix subterranea]
MLTVNFSSRAALLLLAMALPLHANDFHYGIEASHQVQENAAGQLTGLQMHWVYDAAVTAMLIEGEDLQPNNRTATLKTVGDLMLSDLKTHAYFTTITLNDAALPIANVSEYHLDLLPDQRLQLDFVLPFAAPQTLTGKRLAVALADPTGSAIPMYKDQNSITLGAQTQQDCQTTIEQKPTFEHGEAAQIIQLQCR